MSYVLNRIHLMAGIVDGRLTPEHHVTYESNLKYAAHLLEPENIVGVIEPICSYGVPGYYLNSYDRGNWLVDCKPRSI